MHRDRDEGQAAVELALVLPLVVLLLLAVVQVTLVARDQVLVVHAARHAARQAAVDPTRPQAARQAAADAAPNALKSSRLEVDVQRMGGVRQDLVVVRLDYDAPTDVPLVGALLPDVQLHAKAAMRSESGADLGFRPGNVRFRQEPERSAANTAPGVAAVQGPRRPTE